MTKEVKKAILATVALPAALWGANVTFPGSGGDLAGEGPDDWNRSLPSVDDTVILDKSGIYTLSGNVTFKAVRPLADGIVLRFGANRLTTIGNIYGTAQNATIIYDGGTFDLSGTGNFSPAQASVTGASAVITNGCVVTNVGTFYATSYSSLSRAVVTGGSRIHSAKANVCHQGGSGNRLEIMGGAQVHVDETVSFGGSGGTASAHGGSVILVSGAGSLFHQKGGTDSSPFYIRIGNRFEDDSFIVTDGASALSDSGGVTLGKSGSGLTVEKGATASFPLVCFTGSGNRTTVSDGTFTCSTTFSMAYTDGETAYNPAGCSNNVFLATGPGASVTLKGPDFFGTGHHNTIKVENGATLMQSGNLNQFMSQTCNSRFLISGQGTLVGKSDGTLYVASQTSADSINSVSNTVSVSDGATLQVWRMNLQGVANELSISNATVAIMGGDSNNHAFTSGSRASGTTHTNNVVTLCGETPKLTISTDATRCRFLGGSTLRIRVPKDGYEKGHVPIDLACNFMMDSSSAMALDCDEWAAHTGGTLHLIKSKAFEDRSAGESTVDRLEATALPPDCSLVVSGGNVYLKCPRRKGFRVIIR